MFRRLLAVLLVLAVLLAAGWLALRRGDIPYDTLETLYASQESEFLTLADGVKVHYRDEGNEDGPALVLVPGFSASLHTWEAWVRHLGGDYRVISMDLPGHGLSRTPELARMTTADFADAVAEATEMIGADTFTLVGNSMGGATAWQFALKYPERLDGLVLVAASGWPDESGEDRPPLVFRLLANPVGRAVLKDLDTSGLVRDGLENSFVDASLVTDAMVDRYVFLSRAPGHRDGIIALVTGGGERRVATAEALAAIEVPTLILQGEEDNLVPASGAEKFAAAIPGAELVMYESVGHLPQEEIADRSAADLRDFLARRVHAETPEAVPAE